ncbi:MAG: hypothetical protein QM729_09710 [Solirubrobacterales bacterium]
MMVKSRNIEIARWVALAAACLVGIVLLTHTGSSAAAGARRTYVANRPGVTVRITATPRRVIAIRLRSALTCTDGGHRNSVLAFTRLRGIAVGRGGKILFHHGGAGAVTILKARMTRGEIIGRFRRTNRIQPGNVRCGTVTPQGRYVRFTARPRGKS